MRRQDDKTTGAMYANDGAVYASNRNHDEDNEVDGDKRQLFINHQAAMTSIEPTHVPVHGRI